MDPHAVSSQDKKTLERYTKYFAMKFIQVIVQSRLGEKIQTSSKVCPTGSDWFCLVIHDNAEVMGETRRALCGEIPTVGLPLCVEISLRTAEGDHMVLETWALSVQASLEPNSNDRHTAYSRMGLLVKSLISVSRATPAYKLSRRQGPDSYVICYRIYLGQPQFGHLGEGYKCMKVGQLETCIGTLLLTLSYRTKMTISPHRVEKDNAIMVKSDHFRPDLSPRHATRPRFSDMAARQQDSPPSNRRHSDPEKDSNLLLENQKMGAFVDYESAKRLEAAKAAIAIPDVPFSNLLKKRDAKEGERECKGAEMVNGSKTTEGDVHTSQSNSDSRRSSGSVTSGIDDFIMVELKPPFAVPDQHTDVSFFYWECRSAPQLVTFQNNPPATDQVGELGDQLKLFEMNMHEYESFIQSLCESESSK